MRSAIWTINDNNLFHIGILRRGMDKLNITDHGRGITSKEGIWKSKLLLRTEIFAPIESLICLREDLIDIEVLATFIAYHQKSPWGWESDQGNILKKGREYFGEQCRSFKISYPNWYYIFFVNCCFFVQRFEGRVIFISVIMVWVKARSIHVWYRGLIL